MTNVVALDSRRRPPCTCPSHQLGALISRVSAHLDVEGSLLVPRSVLEAVVTDIEATVLSVRAPSCPSSTNEKGTR